MQNILRRSTRTLLQNQLKNIMPVMSQIHSAPTVKLYTNQKYNFCFDAQNLDRVSSYENLISRISSAESIHEVLKIYSVNEQLLKNEHIVLSLRMMGRLIKASNIQDVEKLQQDERYVKLTQSAESAIETLNEYEALDFLFWMRKFKVARIDTRLSFEAREKFFNKIKDFLNSKSFNFRNLVNLYYDYTFINRNSSEICSEILRELKSDKKLLTPFTVIQILQACSRRSSLRQTQELVLAEWVTKNFHNLLDEFDTDQKCIIFKYIALLEMNFNPPKFKSPSLVYILRNHLKDKLDQLSESSVINILTAYQYLPREFPFDLVEEIKEMVIVTFQHNSQNIKSFFLLDFIEVVQKIKRRRLDEQSKAILASEIKSRILHDEFLQKSKNIERIIKIYDNGLKQQALVEALVEYVQTTDRKFFFPSILEFLAKNKVEMTPLLENYLLEENLQNMGVHSQVRLYFLLNYLNQNGEYTEKISQFKTIIDNIATSDPSKFIYMAKQSNIFVTERKEAMQLGCQSLQEKFLNGEIKSLTERQNFVKSVFYSCELRDQRQNWSEFFQNNSDQITADHLNVFVDIFFKLDTLNQNQLTIFLTILQNESAEKIPFRKLQFALKDSQIFLAELVRHDNLSKKFFITMQNLCTAQPTNIRLQYIYGMAMRLNSLGHHSQPYLRLLKKAFDHQKALDNYNLNSQVEFMFSIMLMENNLLQQKHAVDIYEKIEGQISDILVKSKLYSYILQNSSAEFREQRHEQTLQVLEELSTNFTTAHTGKILQSLAIYLSFPSQYVAENKDLLLKTTKDYLPQGNERNMLAVIQALHPRNVKNHYDLYFNFLKEIINVYPTFRKKLSISNIISILGKFVQINCKYPSIYNYILEDIGAQFNKMNPQNRIKSMDYFSYLKIKQTDFFEKNLEVIEQNPQAFKGYLQNIANSLYTIGYDQQSSIQTIENLANSLQRKEFITEIYNYIKYIPVLGAENEAEQLEQWFEHLPIEKQEIHSKIRSKGDTILLHEFITKVYPEKTEWAQKIMNFIDSESNFEESRAQFFQPTNSNTVNNGENIGQYLKAMNLEFQLFQDFNGLQVDIVIPEKKTLVKIVQARDINFDRSTYSGKTQIFRRIYQALDLEYKVVLINNLEFRKCSDDISKVNLLVAEGIESNNSDGQYNFPQQQQQQSEQTIQV